MAYTLRITMNGDKQVELVDVDEFTMGFKFFFIRQINGITTSFDRNVISNIKRKMKSGVFKDVKISTAKKQKAFNSKREHHKGETE